MLCCSRHPIFWGFWGAAPRPLGPSSSPGAAPCSGAPSSLTQLSSGALEERGWWGHGRSRSYRKRKGLNFWRNSHFVAISHLPAWTTLLGWEPTDALVELGNKCCSPDAQGTLKQSFKPTFKGAKRLPEVMLSPGCRRQEVGRPFGGPC